MVTQHEKLEGWVQAAEAIKALRHCTYSLLHNLALL